MNEPRPWESLAGLSGPAKVCTCSDDQLNLVGCDCDAGQNLPVQCRMDCGRWLRTNEEILAGACSGCQPEHDRQELGFVRARPEPDDGYYDDHGRDHSEWLGPEFADEISLEERWEHYAFEERNGMPYGSSF